MNSILARNLPQLLQPEREEELIKLLASVHPADLAEVLALLDADGQLRVLGLLDSEAASEVLLELSDPTREQLFERLPVERLSELVAEMDSDDAADIVADLSEEDKAAVLESIEPEDSAEVRQLLLYDEETAGGIMQLELVSAGLQDTVAATVENIRRKRDEVEDLNYVFVVDGQNRLAGQVSLRMLLLSQPEQTMAGLMTDCELVIGVHEDQEAVARKFLKYDLRSAPVVDDNGRLLGRITVDDVFDVVNEEVDEDFYRLAGTSEEEIYSDKVFRISRLRLPWLIANLSGGLVTGYLVWVFKVALHDVLALVTFIPAIMALGGSVGIQSSTIVVRGMALGRIGPAQVGQVLFKEFRIAMILGVTCGLGGALVARLWHGSSFLGLVVGLSMMSAITMSSLLGTVTPALFRRFNIDPALASGPFVTMCNDIVGILLYMGIATAFLKLLV